MSDLDLNNLISKFISDDTEKTADIITFAEASWGLGITLQPMQKLVLKCFYGLPLDDTIEFAIYDDVKDKIIGNFTEKTALKWLHSKGYCNYSDVPNVKIKELVLVCGRRSGKSTMSSCISAYEIYKLIKLKAPALHYGKPQQQTISLINVAPNDEQAGTLFTMAKTFMYHCPFLKNRIDRDTDGYMSVYTDEDIQNDKNKSSIEFITGGCSSTGIRSKDAILVMMDEMAFFLANGGKFSGDEVYNALVPSCKSFAGDGKAIFMSSPYAKYGKFYDMYKMGMDEGEGSQTLVFQCYSTMMNPKMFSSEDLKTEKKRNPKKFSQEYGAKFSDSCSSWIEDEVEFKELCVDPTYKPPKKGVFGTKYYLGLDLASKNDGFASAIVHDEDDMYILDYANVYFSGSSDVWDIDSSIYKNCTKYKYLERITSKEVTNEIKKLAEKFCIKDGIYDQWCGSAMEEHILNAGIKFLEQVNFSASISSEMYETVKMLLLDGRVKLYDHEVLIPELLMLESISGGDRTGRKTFVEAPKLRGAHDDISEAVVRAIWRCHIKKIESGGRSSKITARASFTNSKINNIIENHNIRDAKSRMRYERAKALWLSR